MSSNKTNEIFHYLECDRTRKITVTAEKSTQFCEETLSKPVKSPSTDKNIKKNN